MGGCCSLECGAKTVAWIQCISAGIFLFSVTLVNIIAIVATVEVENEIKELETLERMAQNKTDDVTTIHDHQHETFSFAYAIIALVLEELIFIANFLMSFFLLKGVYQNKPNYTKVWMIVKLIYVTIIAGYCLLRLILLVFGIDAKLNFYIMNIVFDSLQIFIIHKFFEEKKGEAMPETSL